MRLKLPYAKGGGWKESKEEKILSRDEALELVYSLYLESSGTFVVAGVGNKDKELGYVEKLARNPNNKIYITQPDKETAMQLRERLRDYNNVQIIQDYTFKIRKYVPISSIDVFYALNIVNWKPQRFLTLLKGIYDSLSKNGKLIISFYDYILPSAIDKKYLIETPEEVLKIFNNLVKLLVYYHDNNGVLAVYVLSKPDLEKVYKRLEEVKRGRVEQKILIYQSFFR